MRPSKAMRPTRRGLATAAIAVAVVAAGLLVSPGALLDRLGSLLFSPWFPLVLVGLYLLRPALAWPITALSVLVGYRYGLALGLPVALVGVVGTSLIPYAVARHLRTDAGWIGRATEGSERYFSATGDLRGVIAARLAPTPAEAISAAAGVARVPVAPFVVGTLIGELPWTVAAVLAGHSMRRLSLADASPDPWLVAVLALVAALVLVGPAYRFARRRAAGGEGAT